MVDTIARNGVDARISMIQLRWLNRLKGALFGLKPGEAMMQFRLSPEGTIA